MAWIDHGWMVLEAFEVFEGAVVRVAATATEYGCGTGAGVFVDPAAELAVCELLAGGDGNQWTATFRRADAGPQTPFEIRRVFGRVPLRSHMARAGGRIGAIGIGDGPAGVSVEEGLYVSSSGSLWPLGAATPVRLRDGEHGVHNPDTYAIAPAFDGFVLTYLGDTDAPGLRWRLARGVPLELTPPRPVHGPGEAGLAHGLAALPDRLAFAWIDAGPQVRFAEGFACPPVAPEGD